MNFEKVNNDSLQKWERRILNGYWAISFIVFIVNMLSFSIATNLEFSFEAKKFFINHILTTTVGLILILVICEILLRKKIHFNHYLLIITSFLLVVTIIFGSVPYFFIMLQSALALPIFVSIIYLEQEKLYYTLISIILFHILFYVINPLPLYHLNIYELIVVICGLISTGVIGLVIIKRGRDLLESLEKAMKSEKDLLVQNILMDKLSKMDALTDLYNHKTFHEYLDKLIEHAELNGLSLQLALIDIDNFKKVNDTYGHWVGDLVLKGVAQQIREQVTLNDFVARYGGEEFAVIFTDKSLEETIQILENIRQTIEAMTYPELENQAVTISIGLHHYAAGDGKETLFKSTDSALYVAKRTGKNKIVVE